MFVQNFPSTFLTGFSGQISLGLGVPTNKSVLILRILNTLYQKDEDAGGRQEIIRQSYLKSGSGPPTMSSKMGKPRENKLFSVSHRKITVQSHVSGRRLGAYVVNENFMSACLHPPHASFTCPVYIICYYMLINLKKVFLLLIRVHRFALLLMLLQYLKTHKTLWVLLLE